VVNATPQPLHPWERHSTHCIGDLVGLKASLDGCRKSRPPLGFNSQTVQPIASRYTNWAIPVHSSTYWVKKNQENTFTNSGLRNCSQPSSTTATSTKQSAERLVPIAHTHLQFPYNPHYIILPSLLGISKLLSFSKLPPPNSCTHLSALPSLPLTLTILAVLRQLHKPWVPIHAAP